MKRIRVSSSFIILIVLSLFSGFFMRVIVLLGIIFLHEIGHIIACIKYNRKIDRIFVLPFGAFMKYEEDSNTFLREEFFIAASGVFMNILIFIFGKILHFPEYVLAMNQYVLWFNLLTIYPLDGGRIIEIILCKFMRFKMAVFMTILISFSTIFLLLVLNLLSFNSLNLFLMLGMLLIENIKYFKNKNIRFNRFLLKKYLNKNEDLQEKKLNPSSPNLLKSFFKGYNNCLFLKDKLVKKEPELLDEFYKN